MLSGTLCISFGDQFGDAFVCVPCSSFGGVLGPKGRLEGTRKESTSCVFLHNLCGFWAKWGAIRDPRVALYRDF